MSFQKCSVQSQNTNSDSWKSQYIVAGPSFNLINKFGLNIRAGVKSGFNFTSESPNISIVDQANPQQIYQFFDPINEKSQSFLIKPSLDFSFYPGNGNIGISFGASYFNVEKPQASSFGLDFSVDQIPTDLLDNPDRVRELLFRWPMIDRVEEPNNNGLAFKIVKQPSLFLVSLGL